MACVSGCSGMVLNYWSAYVTVSVGNHTLKPCECGMYGWHSPLLPERGLVVLPNQDPEACKHPTFNITQSPWIALIKRGNCTYKDKIHAAKKHNASAVVIYNLDGTGNETSTMSHEGTGDDVVVIMIGNELGKDISSLIHKGEEVFMSINVGNPHGHMNTPVWIFIMSFVFFIVTAVIMIYFTIKSVKKIRRHLMLKKEQRYLKSVAQKAIQKLKLRTIKKGDEEVGSESHSCAVCIEGYNHGEVVMILTCSHFFHKSCVEPWLLEHRTCPMCKSNILGVKTVDEEVSSEATPSPLDVRFRPDSQPSPFYENLDEVALSDPEEDTPSAQETRQGPIQAGLRPELTQAKDQFHDNPAFEGESKNMDLR